MLDRRLDRPLNRHLGRDLDRSLGRPFDGDLIVIRPTSQKINYGVRATFS